jgi:hypothetical protein
MSDQAGVGHQWRFSTAGVGRGRGEFFLPSTFTAENKSVAWPIAAKREARPKQTALMIVSAVYAMALLATRRCPIVNLHN